MRKRGLEMPMRLQSRRFISILSFLYLSQRGDKMFMFRGMCFAGLVFGASLSVQAEELVDAATALCETVKTCSMAQVAKEDLTPEMQQMMEPMLENMCTAMRSGVQDVPTGHGLYEPAVACMRSMAALTCEQLQDEQQVETDACKEYEKLAKEVAGE
jgi:hypothetical protein